MPAPVDALHGLCGRVEVARDLVERAQALGVEPRDAYLSDRFSEASEALHLLIEAIIGRIHGVTAA